MSNSIEQVLAFDFGTTRIGVAAGQSVTASASPLPPVRARDGIPDWEQLDAMINEWQPHALVIGIPLNMDGTLQDLSHRARKFANRLHERYKTPVF